MCIRDRVQDTDQVKLRAKRTDAAGTGNPVELSKELGQFAFDGKLVKDASNENSAVATAYLPTGEYQFEIKTGIAGDVYKRQSMTRPHWRQTSW